MNLKKLIRKNVLDFAAYTPGEQPTEEGWIKLNTNENPYPPIPEVMEDLSIALNDNLRKYPDPLAIKLRKILIEQFLNDKYKIDKVESILIGNGSDEILDIVFKAFVEKNDEIVFFNPSYGMYKVLTALYEGKAHEIKLNEDFSIPRFAFDVKGKLLIINSPNNPNGKSYSNELIEKFCKKFTGIVLVDEAYADFSNITALSILPNFENLIVIRTFSKSFSLASMRIGYAVAHPSIINELNKVKLPYNTSYIAQVAAISCLKNIKKIFSRNEKIIFQREQLINELKKIPSIKVFPSDANFVLIKFPNKNIAKSSHEELKKQKILVRYFNTAELEEYLRISIGREEENIFFLNSFNNIIKKSSKFKSKF
ncbi:MAG: histidinol-phosphate transaminase [Promethearchaeota archaeon]